MPDQHHARLTLVAPGGIRTALQQLLPAFEKATGHSVLATFASGGATKTKIIEGEFFDVPVMQPPLDRVIASGQVVPSSETPIATVSVVAAVRTDAPKPDIATGDGVKCMLLAASSIACPGVARGAACGVSFEATLKTLGIAESVMPKVKAAPSGWESIAMLARGEVEIGITFNSEIDPDPRVALLGPLPRDISTPTGFVAFIHARSPQPAAAHALTQFLSSADAAKTFAACGMTPGR